MLDPIKNPDYCSVQVKLIFTGHYINNGEISHKELSIDYLFMILFNKLMESFESNASPHYPKLL